MESHYFITAVHVYPRSNGWLVLWIAATCKVVCLSSRLPGAVCVAYKTPAVYVVRSAWLSSPRVCSWARCLTVAGLASGQSWIPIDADVSRVVPVFGVINLEHSTGLDLPYSPSVFRGFGTFNLGLRALTNFTGI